MAPAERLWKLVCAAVIVTLAARAEGQIDRRALVARHNVTYTQPTPAAPLAVGNGNFAFNFDVTGLQTFPSETDGHPPLTTMAQWAWHSFPGGDEHDYSETLRDFDVDGRAVSYAVDQQSDAAQYLRANPHRINLGRIGLRLARADGAQAEASDLEEVKQTLTLWSGEARSQFQFDGAPVTVRTVAHPSLDAVAVSVESPLVAEGRVAIEVRFSYPSGAWGPGLTRWDQPDRHATELTETESGFRLKRTLDETEYVVDVRASGPQMAAVGDEPHAFRIEVRDAETLEATFHFAPQAPEERTPEFAAVRTAAADQWRRFWGRGGAVDLSESTDERWRELERRIVLSQYVTSIHCAGAMPPQETGLVCNSWYGKSHLEMHWWHAAHFPLWGRMELLERSIDWYNDILPAAKSIAERQGYGGARWPKMTGPHGVSSPSSVGEFLIWQQPHPIYFAELAYRDSPTRETLERYEQIVAETAQFMADYARLDEANDRYVLGPVLIPAQECYDPREPPGVLNPTFELVYWKWGLQTANRWRRRMGLEPEPRWREVADKMARPHVAGEQYTAIETPPYTRRRDHPSMLAALGVLPGAGLIDPPTMDRTLSDVAGAWQWPDTWGWDYPMMAMTAARLGRGSDAVHYLLMETPKNRYLPNGHCFQENRLPVYLPANGGLLTAVAMMAAGWDDAEDRPAPGFPQDGSWVVKHEGLQELP